MNADHHAHDHAHDHEHDHDHAHGWWGRLRHAVTPHSHDVGEIVDELAATSAGIRAVWTSLAVLGVTALVQLAVVIVTGSTALLADTIHNFADALTALPLAFAFALGRRPATRRYPHGYGRVEDLAGAFVVAMIAASAVLAGYESVRRIIEGSSMSHPWVVMAAGVVGFVGNEVVAGYRIRTGTRIGSVALVADGAHARADGFTSLAVVVGAIGVLLGFPLADPIVGLLITVAIVGVLVGTGRDVLARLLDAVDPELTLATEEALAGTPGVLAAEEVRLRWVGHRLAADATVRVDDRLDLGAAHLIVTEAERRVRRRVARVGSVRLHVCPGSATHEQARVHAPVRGSVEGSVEGSV